MLRRSIGCGLVVLLAVLVCESLPAEEPLKSSLQPGEQIPSAFEPLNVTGENAGKRYCLVCENGLNPVVMIFARSVSEPLVRLLSKVDAATVQNRRAEMGSFVVFLDKTDGLDRRLQEVARKQKIAQLILSIDDPAGPEGYVVAKDADVTVVLYHKHVVKANHAFRKDQLTDKAIEKILTDLPKILPAK